MYAEALSELVGYAAGSAMATGIERAIEGSEPDPSAGVVERAREDEVRKGRIALTVSSVVALAMVLSLFRGR